jgi:hypothetical protein
MLVREREAENSDLVRGSVKLTVPASTRSQGEIAIVYDCRTSRLLSDNAAKLQWP